MKIKQYAIIVSNENYIYDIACDHAVTKSHDQKLNLL